MKLLKSDEHFFNSHKNYFMELIAVDFICLKLRYYMIPLLSYISYLFKSHSFLNQS